MSFPQGLNEMYLRPNVQIPYPLAPQEEPRGLTNWARPHVCQETTQLRGTIIFEIAQGRALFEQSRLRIAQDIEELRAFYVFADDAVDHFLTDHRALPSVLREAIEPLKTSFGADKVFQLQVSTDEEDCKMLYAIALWRDTVRAAALALDHFVETWWLDHMTPDTTELAFIYRISR
jgi:hypothetical protein